MTGLATRATNALESIEELCGRDLTPQRLIEEVGDRIAQVVPADGMFLATADPETALCMGAGVVVGMPEESCQPLWDHEYLVPDYNKFSDLAAGPQTVADLHVATGGRPQRSARWREFHALNGFRAELRMAFTAGGSPWGMGQLNRTEDLPLFTDEDVAFLERAAPVVGRGLRSAMLYEACCTTERGPGILVLDAGGEVVSATAEAEAWLAEVESTLFARTPLGVPVPIEAHMYAAASRAEGSRPVRARLRTRDGMWLVMHASPLRGDRADGEIALVIEPAKASDIAPIIVEAYGLTAREVDVTRLVARGHRTAEIAERLFLSAHTVRDHLKSVFEKVGVSSRGELVSRLFADQYYDGLAAAIDHDRARVGP